MVVTKILATILAIRTVTYLVIASLHARLGSYTANQHSWKTPQNQQTSLIAIVSYLAIFV